MRKYLNFYYMNGMYNACWFAFIFKPRKHDSSLYESNVKLMIVNIGFQTLLMFVLGVAPWGRVFTKNIKMLVYPF